MSMRARISHRLGESGEEETILKTALGIAECCSKWLIMSKNKTIKLSRIKRTSFTVTAIIGVLLLLCVHIFELMQSWKTGSCDREDTIIFYQFKTDYEIGCEGISRAEHFFQNFGFAIDTPITMFFEKHIPVDKEIYDPGQLLGYVNVNSLYILTPSYIFSFLRKSKNHFFRVEVISKSRFKELLTSTVAHEVAHLLALHNFEMRTQLPLEIYPKEQMGNGVQEYIASIVQFYSMESNFRNQISQQFDKKLIFHNEQEINNLLFSHSPQEFYIMSYRHFHSKDRKSQKQILERIFTNELNPDSLFELDL